MVKVKMIQDGSGTIYWLMRNGERDIRIIRCNSVNADMGDDDFIQEVA
jgi:hypothetical protein